MEKDMVQYIYIYIYASRTVTFSDRQKIRELLKKSGDEYIFSEEQSLNETFKYNFQKKETFKYVELITDMSKMGSPLLNP